MECRRLEGGNKFKGGMGRKGEGGKEWWWDDDYKQRVMDGG